MALIKCRNYSQGTGLTNQGNILEPYSGSQLSREGGPVAT